MDRLKHQLHNQQARKRRVRAVVSGTPERPRLNVFVSNRHVNVQLIDDTHHTTLLSVTTVGIKGLSGPLSEKAAWAGSEIAKKAKAIKLKRVVLDRGGKRYHGRIKALADAARANGLEF